MVHNKNYNENQAFYESSYSMGTNGAGSSTKAILINGSPLSMERLIGHVPFAPKIHPLAFLSSLTSLISSHSFKECKRVIL